jgi:predicted transcriptional regulator
MPQPNADNTVRLEIRLAKLQADRLKTLANSTYRTKTSIISQALDDLFLKLGTEMK